MKRITVILLFLFIASYTFSQEVNKPDTVNLTDAMKGNSEAEVGNSLELINVSLLAVRESATESLPLIHFDYRFRNVLPPLIEIDYRKGYYFSKQAKLFYVKERSFGTHRSFFMDSEIDFLINNYFSLDFTRIHNYNAYGIPLFPEFTYQDQFGLGFSLKLSPKLKFNTGAERVLIKNTGKWKTIQINTLHLGF